MGLQQGRNKRLPAKAMQALGNVEHQVPAVALVQAVDEGAGGANAIGLVSQRAERSLNGRDGSDLVKFGGFLFIISGTRVVLTEVICDADDHSSRDAVSWAI